MLENDCGKATSRRDFLKQTCKTMGYALPIVGAFKLSSREAWADNYGRGKSNGKCDELVEKVFNSSCW